MLIVVPAIFQTVMDESANLKWMKRALVLARRGRGLASPNPLVGAVVVRQGRIVGEGFHRFADRIHAEVAALNQAGTRAQGADLYLNLEPCCHQGRTPPCVERILSAGIRRVFASVQDPNPVVAGRGFEWLRRAGVEVHEGLCGRQAAELNEDFFHYISSGYPFVLLKLALTLDGKMATRTGDSKWITSSRSRKHVHRLRFEKDALLAGVETILQDDPTLNVRWRRRKAVTRVVLDSTLRTPPDSRLFSVEDPVLIFHCSWAPAEKRKGLEGKAELIEVERGRSGVDWEPVLKELGRRQIISLLIEGGGKVAASALRSGFVNRAAFFYAPLLIGAEGLSGIGELGIDRLTQAVRLRDLKLKRLAPDFLVDALVENNPENSDPVWREEEDS